jgi:hypothetical protein
VLVVWMRLFLLLFCSLFLLSHCLRVRGFLSLEPGLWPIV